MGRAASFIQLSLLLFCLFLCSGNFLCLLCFLSICIFLIFCSFLFLVHEPAISMKLQFHSLKYEQGKLKNWREFGHFIFEHSLHSLIQSLLTLHVGHRIWLLSHVGIGLLFWIDRPLSEWNFFSYCQIVNWC